MDIKKILIGLVGGAVTGYVYQQYVAKKKSSQTVAQGVEEVVEEGEGETKSIGGGGGFGGSALPTETIETEAIATETTEPTIEPKPAVTTKPMTKPSTSLVSPTKPVDSKPTIYTKPAEIVRKPQTAPVSLDKGSRFSGIGGDRWDADLNNLDI